MTDPKIQEELRAKYNPEGSELRKLQEKLLVMLEYFDKVCRDNDIHYWLSSGSALGAIRHGGFIPWDDDVDVEMLREDYQKLLKVFKENDDYVLQTHKNDLFYTQPFGKMRDKHSYYEEKMEPELYSLMKYRGVYIDIFVMEKSSLPAAKVAHVIMAGARHISKSLHDNAIGRMCQHLLKSTAFISMNVIRLLTCMSDKNTLRHTLGTGCENNVRKLDELLPVRYVDFEGSNYPVPNNVDAYLRRMFGDYMQLPKEVRIHSTNFRID